MQPFIAQINTLIADMTGISNANTGITPVIIGSTGTGNLPCSYNLPAGKKIYFEFDGIVSLGATGGFRFQADNAGVEDIYLAVWECSENTTPATFRANQIAQADFTNAAAVAADYAVKLRGCVRNDATAAGIFSLKVAQNNATANALTVRKGSTFKLFIE